MTSGPVADNGGVDLFGALLSAFQPSGHMMRRRSVSEAVAAGIAFFLLPLVEIAVTMIWHLRDPALVCVWLPLAFGALAFLISRALAGIWLSLLVALGCAFTCFLWGCFVVVVSLMTWSY
jgi:hypothetical protein